MNRMLATSFEVINALLALVIITSGVVIGYNALGGMLPFTQFLDPLMERAPELRRIAATREGLAIIGGLVGFLIASVVCGFFAILISIEQSLRSMSRRG